MSRLRIPTILALALCVTARAGAQSAVVAGSATRIDSLTPTNERTIIDALRGRVPGARVIATSGAPGSVPTLVIRNAGMNHTAAPVIVIDGVVTRLTLADLNVNDVASVEVRKGAATAAEYGLGAANGVLLITTKRAADSTGERLTLRSDFGMNSPPRFAATARHHPFVLTADGRDFVWNSIGLRTIDPDLMVDNPFPREFDNRRAMVESRPLFASHMDGSKRWDNTATWLSLSHDRDPGVLTRLDGLERSHGRLGVDHALFGARLRLAGTAMLATSRNDAPPMVDQWFRVLPLLEPWFPLDSLEPSCQTGTCYVAAAPVGLFTSPNPLLEREAMPTNAHARRTSASFRVRYAMRDWLEAEGSINTDRRRATMRAERGPTTVFPGTFRIETGDTARISTTTLGIAARRAFREDAIRLRTRIGVVEEQQRQESHEFQGSSEAYTSSGLATRMKTTTATLSTAVDVGDRVTLDGVLTRLSFRMFDRGSTPRVYHRFGAGWRLTDRYRVHAGYGTSTPTSFSMEEGYVAFFRSDATPPFAREVEAGLDAQLPRDGHLRYTHSRQRTAGQLVPMLVVVPTFPSYSEWRRIGSTLGYAHEISIDGPVLRRERIRWNVAVAAHHARARVERLDAPFQQLYLSNHTIITPGGRLGVIWGQRWIRTPEQLQQALASGTLTGSAADFVQNEDGYFVRATERGTTNERPISFTYACDPGAPCPGFGSRHEIGDQNADLELGITNDVKLGSFALSATVTGVLGGDIVNYQRQTAVRVGRDPMVDQSDRPSASRKSLVYYATLGGTFAPNELFIESATHVKLRGLTVDWTVPPRLASRIGVGGRDVTVGVTARNLWTSGSYRGYDPDVVTSSAQITDMRDDRALYPAYRSIALRIGFVTDPP